MARKPIHVFVLDSTLMATDLLVASLKRDAGLAAVRAGDAGDFLSKMRQAEASDRCVGVLATAIGGARTRGFELCRALHDCVRPAAVVLLLESFEETEVLDAFRSGARGVFCRHEPPALLGKCIQSVHSGQVWANSRQLQMLVSALAKTVPFRGESLPFTKREQEVVEALCEGLSNRRIAERLFLSEHTIKNYLLRIFEKFGVSSRGELMFKIMGQSASAQNGPRRDDLISPIDSPIRNQSHKQEGQSFDFLEQKLRVA